MAPSHNRLHQQTAKIQGSDNRTYLRRNTSYSRQTYEILILYPVQRIVYSRTTSIYRPRSTNKILRNTATVYYGQGQAIYVELLENTSSRTQNQTQIIDSVSPIDGRSNRTNKLVTRSLSQTLPDVQTR